MGLFSNLFARSATIQALSHERKSAGFAYPYPLSVCFAADNALTPIWCLPSANLKFSVPKQRLLRRDRRSAVTQDIFLDLTRGRLGQFRHKGERLRHFEVGHVV